MKPDPVDAEEIVLLRLLYRKVLKTMSADEDTDIEDAGDAVIEAFIAAFGFYKRHGRKH